METPIVKIEHLSHRYTSQWAIKDINFEIYLKPTEKDYLWNPEHSVMLKNINIKVFAY